MSTRQAAAKLSKKTDSSKVLSFSSDDVSSIDDNGKELDEITPATLQNDWDVGNTTLTAKSQTKRKRLKRPHSSKFSDPDSIHFKHKLPPDDTSHLSPSFQRGSDEKKIEKMHQLGLASQESLASDIDDDIGDSEMESICEAHGLGKMMRSPTPVQFPLEEDDSELLKWADKKISRDKLQAELEDEKVQTSLFSTLAKIKEEVAARIPDKMSSTSTSSSQDMPFAFIKEEVIVAVPEKTKSKLKRSSQAKTLAAIKEEAVASIPVEVKSTSTSSSEEVIASTPDETNLTSARSSQDTKALLIPPGIHTIEEYVIFPIKTHLKFTSADFDAFKDITKPLPIPKFKILGLAELDSLRSEPTLPSATTGKARCGQYHDDRYEMDGAVKNDRQDTAMKNWLTLEDPKEGRYIAMDPARQRTSTVVKPGYLAICKNVPGRRSLRCIVRVDAVFEQCWSKDGRKASDGPDLVFTFASLKPVPKDGWEQLRISCCIADKRSHFSIEKFMFNGPASDRMRYGPTFLEAVCNFLRDHYHCPEYLPPTQIRWDLQTLESAECHFEQIEEVKREVANNSEVLKFLSNTFEEAGNGSFVRRLYIE